MIAQPRALDTAVNTGWKAMLPLVSNLNQNMTATVLDAVAHKVIIAIKILGWGSFDSLASPDLYFLDSCFAVMLLAYRPAILVKNSTA